MDHSKILKEAYNQFILTFGKTKVPTPYRINVPYVPDRQVNKTTIFSGGKSSPEVLMQNLQTLAESENFDLEKKNVEEIQSFMHKNMLGIDCSGFAYHLLDYLLKKIGKGGMKKVGFPGPGKSDVEVLTLPKFSKKIASFDQVQPGDLIRLDNLAKDGLQHVIIVLAKEWGFVNYAHSSRKTHVKGVHADNISFGKFPHDLHNFSYNPETSKDGIYRLKALI